MMDLPDPAQMFQKTTRAGYPVTKLKFNVNLEGHLLCVTGIINETILGVWNLTGKVISPAGQDEYDLLNAFPEAKDLIQISATKKEPPVSLELTRLRITICPNNGLIVAFGGFGSDHKEAEYPFASIADFIPWLKANAKVF